jgi:hypothetical protein
MIMKKLIALLALLVSAPALATQVTFTVAAPTQYSDGSAIPASVILGTAIDCGPTAVIGDFAGGWGYAGSVLQPATTLTVDFPDGTYYCAAHTAKSGRDASGNFFTLSPYSNIVSFTLPVVIVPPPVIIDPNTQVPVAPSLTVTISQ